MVIQTAIAVSTLLMFAAGQFGIRATEKMQEQQKKPSELSFEEKMRPSIGKTFTEERYYKLLELMRTHDTAKTSLIETVAAASDAMRFAGGLVALGALASIFLLLKRPNIS